MVEINRRLWTSISKETYRIQKGNSTQNIRIKLPKTEIREISFHGTFCRVLGNCHQILFKLGHIFQTISINADLALIVAL